MADGGQRLHLGRTRREHLQLHVLLDCHLHVQARQVLTRLVHKERADQVRRLVRLVFLHSDTDANHRVLVDVYQLRLSLRHLWDWSCRLGEPAEKVF